MNKPKLHVLRPSSIILLIFLVSSIVLLPSSIVYSAVPHFINYQGKLTDTSGTPLNGSYDITFRIYDAESAGQLLWQEKHIGTVIQKGIFSVLLGSVTNLDLPFDKQYYLAIQVGSDPEMSPRQRLASAPYAISAEHGVPKGVIVMWAGRIADIPSGWALCDGTNGTPDLRDRFIVGARQDEGGIAKTNVTGSLTQSGDGSMPSHVHGTGTLITNSPGDHSHNIRIIGGGNQGGRLDVSTSSWNEGYYNTSSAGSHTHTISGETGNAGSGTKVVATYYALSFIMKL